MHLTHSIMLLALHRWTEKVWNEVGLCWMDLQGLFHRWLWEGDQTPWMPFVIHSTGATQPKPICTLASSWLVSNKFLALIMLCKITKAIPQAIIHHHVLSVFTKSLQREHGDNLVNDWEAQVKWWENDHKEKCPYDLLELSTWPLTYARKILILWLFQRHHLLRLNASWP